MLPWILTSNWPVERDIALGVFFLSPLFFCSFSEQLWNGWWWSKAVALRLKNNNYRATWSTVWPWGDTCWDRDFWEDCLEYFSLVNHLSMHNDKLQIVSKWPHNSSQHQQQWWLSVGTSMLQICKQPKLSLANDQLINCIYFLLNGESVILHILYFI